jgi:hypothetical protein
VKSGAGWRFCALSCCLLTALSLLAVTTVPVKVKCPVCGEENEFFDYASWGSYVYFWPSKFQMVFWPQTYSSSMYICKRCHYAAWMWDFKKLSSDKVAEIRKELDGVSGVPHFEKYTDVPMTIRLGIAERAYRVEGKDDLFWSDFYRTEGYHLAAERHPQEAKKAREKAREILDRLLQDPKLASRRKEFLVSRGAMEHFIGDDSTALATLAQARKEKFTAGENAKGYNEYLDKLIDEYLEKIKTQSVPADDRGESE